jgi:hypothetical protein
VEQALITKIKALSPQQVAEVVNFVELLATKSASAAKDAGADRSLHRRGLIGAAVARLAFVGKAAKNLVLMPAHRLATPSLRCHA